MHAKGATANTEFLSVAANHENNWGLRLTANMSRTVCGLPELPGVSATPFTGLALSAAATYAPKNIRVNCVAPGLTKASRVCIRLLLMGCFALQHMFRAARTASGQAWLVRG